ncbi:MAG: PQQ-binding-like beta-propeller repeat protein [Planctomycetes bacterium]|nr:PQQ-binding-like beta-propeller repeat protein [Planctomycetota bacterium]
MFAALIACHAAGQQPKPTIPAMPGIAWHHADVVTPFTTAPACRKDLVFCGGERLLALDIHSGRVVAQAKVDGPWQAPVLGGGLVFARHQDGSVHAFAPALDRRLWHVALAPTPYPGICCGDIFVVAAGHEIVAITGGAELWRQDLGGPVLMTPATDGHRIYAGTMTGKLVALAVGDGKPVWEREVDAPVGASSPVVDGDTVFVADRGDDGRRGMLHAVAADSGQPRWQTGFGATGFSTPFPSEDGVWAGFGTSVVRFDRRTGAMAPGRIRTGRNPFGRPGVVGDAVVFGNLDGSFYVHDRQTLALRWRFTPGDGVQVGGWELQNGVLLVGSTNGLWALVDTPEAPPAPPGFVLQPGENR